MTVCAAAKNRSHRYKQDIKTLPAVNAAGSVYDARLIHPKFNCMLCILLERVMVEP